MGSCLPASGCAPDEGEAVQRVTCSRAEEGITCPIILLFISPPTSWQDATLLQNTQYWQGQGTQKAGPLLGAKEHIWVTFWETGIGAILLPMQS